MEIVKYIACTLIAYCLGSVSMSIILSRTVLGGDVRKQGSGNAGATNMARVYGITAGILTLLGDVAKAALGLYIGNKLLGDPGIATAGIACMLGHCFPLYHNFKGGKGVSVGAALAFAVDWKVFAVVVATFLIVAFISRKVSLGSVCAAVSITIASAVFEVSPEKMFMASVAMVIVVVQHRENLKRLVKGIEPDFKAANKKII